ncbi:hypothetical protein Dsin_004083 [Dipteronia sinensis]|uniref:BED-type domain-containing protein n=1 Tax=Dipteronia sinensis TaxID=43782 RepID=A0AAE0B9B3_9ROSI|nr:hypothetical protein Dsin_004083 [Dipteronia sinensis]
MKRDGHRFARVKTVINLLICAAPPWLIRQFMKCRKWHCKPALSRAKDSAFKRSLGSTSLENQASPTMAIGSSSAEASGSSLFEDQLEPQGSHEQVIHDAAIEPAQIDHDETVNPDVEVLTPPPPPKGRKKRSDAWAYFTSVRDPDGKEWVVCEGCTKTYARSRKKETSNMLKHLKKCPGRRNGGEDKPADTRCIKLHVLSNKKIAPDQEWNQLTQARSIIEKGHPWSMVQQSTLKAAILRVYEGEKKELRRSLGNLSCRLNLTMNLLKHESHDSKTIYCYLTLHFIDDNWELWKKILSFKKLVSWESHWDLSVAFRDMLLDWKSAKIYAL